jgi:hypothetical protein
MRCSIPESVVQLGVIYICRFLERIPAVSTMAPNSAKSGGLSGLWWILAADDQREHITVNYLNHPRNTPD